MIMMTEMFARIEAKPNDQLKAEDMEFAVSSAGTSCVTWEHMFVLLRKVTMQPFLAFFVQLSGPQESTCQVLQLFCAV